MAPVTRGPFGLLTAGLKSVSRNTPHFRRGRWFLLAEGVLLGACGAWGFLSAANHPNAGPTGSPVLMLHLTSWHSAVLLALGLAAVLGSVQRHAAVVVTAAATLVLLLLMFIGAVAAAHHDPGPLGFDNRDIVLHGILAAANFALLYWLIPDVLEGRDWTTRRTSRDPDASTPKTVP